MGSGYRLSSARLGVRCSLGRGPATQQGLHHPKPGKSSRIVPEHPRLHLSYPVVRGMRSRLNLERPARRSSFGEVRARRKARVSAGAGTRQLWTRLGRVSSAVQALASPGPSGSRPCRGAPGSIRADGQGRARPARALPGCGARRATRRRSSLARASRDGHRRRDASPPRSLPPSAGRPDTVLPCCAVGDRRGSRAGSPATAAAPPRRERTTPYGSSSVWTADTSAALHGRRRAGYCSTWETERLFEHKLHASRHPPVVQSGHVISDRAG
jgi:hypothetical protein